MSRMYKAGPVGSSWMLSSVAPPPPPPPQGSFAIGSSASSDLQLTGEQGGVALSAGMGEGVGMCETVSYCADLPRAACAHARR